MTELPPAGRLSSVPLVAHRTAELEDLPTVRTSFFEQVPYVEVVDNGRAVLNLTLTDAVNLGLLLVAEAGQGLNRLLARVLPQSEVAP
jgi:hypothetical protein